MPNSYDIDPYYGDFGNGYIPFFTVIGNQNLVLYGDNPVAGATSMVDYAVYTFSHLFPIGSIDDQTMSFNTQVEIDLDGLFFDPNEQDITLMISDNSDPDVVTAELNGTTLNLTSHQVFGTSEIEIVALAPGGDSAFLNFEVIVVPNTMEITYDIEDSPEQTEYPGNINPYSNTLTDLGWTQFDVAESNQIIFVRVELTWNSLDYPTEGTLHMTSPSGTNVLLYESADTGPTGLELILYDFTEEDMMGTWDLYIEDSYNDGGHQVTNCSVIFGVESSELYYPPTSVEVDDASGLVTWEEPLPPFEFMDDFEAYSVGDYIADVNSDWTTWSNAPGGSEDGMISDTYAYSGTQSLHLVLNSDQVLPFGENTEGVFEVGLMIYVPTGYCGYFNLLHQLDDYGVANEWGLEVYFHDTGDVEINAGGTGSATTTYALDTWVSCKAIVDLDADQAEFYIDETLIHSWQWSLQASGTAGVNMLSAMNIWGGGDGTPEFYVDDVYVGPYELDRELSGYNVYLDGTEVANGLTETQYQLEGLVYGETYTAGVTALYDDGNESAVVEVEFTYTGTDAGDDIVLRTALQGNYPNPFNPVTTIAYSLKEEATVTLEIYNIKGQLVRSLVDEAVNAGPQEAIWNGMDDNNSRVTSGVYFYKLKAGDYTSTKKMILLK